MIRGWKENSMFIIALCANVWNVIIMVGSGRGRRFSRSTIIVVGSTLLQHRNAQRQQRSAFYEYLQYVVFYQSFQNYALATMQTMCKRIGNGYKRKAFSSKLQWAQKSAEMLGSHTHTHTHTMALINPSLIYMQNFWLDTISCQRCHPVCCTMRFAETRENSTNSHAD